MLKSEERKMKIFVLQSWKEKNENIIKFINKYQFDISDLAETNIHWPSLDPKARWQERVLGQFESIHNSIACSTKDATNLAWQPGGCLQMSMGRMVSRVLSSGVDSKGLGRWSWTRFRG